MTTAEEIKGWVAAATPPDPDRGWYGACAGLTDRVVAFFTGGDRRWYGSATDARRASGALNPDATQCPAGGIHFWSYYGTAWDGSVGDWGHVTIDITGGGGDTLSATGHAREWWALNAGLISVAAQSARAGMQYLGWSRTYGGARPLTITTESTAGTGSRPFEEDFMATMTDEEKSRLLTQLDQIHKELVAQPGAGWTRARIFATGDAVDKLVGTVDGIRKKIDDLWNYTRMKVDSIWKWALGKRASENVTGMPDDSPFRRTVDTPSQ